MPTRFPGGLTTALPTDALNNLPVPDPTKNSYVWMDQAWEFSDAAAAAPVGFTTTKTGTGTTTAPEVAGMFGALSITNSGADNDAVFIQSKGHIAASDAGKRMQFACRVAMSDATQTDVIMGITSTDTTPIGAAATEETGVSDGMYFLKIDGATDWRFVVRSGSATIAYPTALGTITAATADTLAFDYNPQNKEVSVYVNNVKKTTVTATTFPAGVQFLQMGVQNGDAAARTLQIDWVGFAQER